jgi:hypothetical protein
MQILNSTIKDLNEILRLYDLAIAYQKTKSDKYWKGFHEQLIKNEIENGSHWKIVANGIIVCIFSTTKEDAIIWKEKNSDPAIYLHRIVTNPNFRGNNYVLVILEWLKLNSKRMEIEYIRLDTFADNQSLVDYYIKCGFKFLDTITMTESTGLPKHYENAKLGLFEIKLQ